ncbi:MAG: carbohydrate porin [Leptospirales bacterium]
MSIITYFKFIIKASLVIFMGLFLAVNTIYGQDGDIGGDYMSGDYRQKLADKGVGFEFVYSTELGYNAIGGVKQGGVSLSNFDMTLDLDMEKLVGWTGGEIFIYGLHGFGGSPTALVGDWQGTSNIETGMDYVKLYEAWVQQSFGDGIVSVLFGLHDLNSEFYGNDPAGLFLNSSMGVGAEIAQTGLNGPSIFPSTAPALRVAVNPTENLYILAGLYNARAGDPADPSATNADFTFQDGFLYIGELGYYVEGDIKVAAGGWGYTSPELDMATGKDATPYGAYLLFDKTFGEVFSVFVRGGLTNQNIYAVAYNIMEGIVLSGSLWNRPDDQLGLGASTIIAGTPYSDLVPLADSAETSIELTYLLQLSPWFSLQPNFQYVLNPGLDPNLDDALMIALRATISF